MAERPYPFPHPCPVSGPIGNGYPYSWCRRCKSCRSSLNAGGVETPGKEASCGRRLSRSRLLPVRRTLPAGGFYTPGSLVTRTGRSVWVTTPNGSRAMWDCSQMRSLACPALAPKGPRGEENNDVLEDGFEQEEDSAEPADPRSAMTANSAGGYTFAVDNWTRLARFLVLEAKAARTTLPSGRCRWKTRRP